MRHLTAFALLFALSFATAGCSSLASQSKGDIERQSESQGVALEAVQKGADISDHAARTATEGNISVIEATARAETEKLRAEAELAREQQELERIRTENQERIERIRAEIERENLRVERELAAIRAANLERIEIARAEIERENLRTEREIVAMQENAERYRAGLRTNVSKNTCYNDRIIEVAGPLRIEPGTTWELEKSGNIVITEGPQTEGRYSETIDYRDRLRICPRDVATAAPESAALQQWGIPQSDFLRELAEERGVSQSEAFRGLALTAAESRGISEAEASAWLRSRLAAKQAEQAPHRSQNLVVGGIVRWPGHLRHFLYKN